MTTRLFSRSIAIQLIALAAAAPSFAAPRDIYLRFNGTSAAVTIANSTAVGDGGSAVTVGAWAKPAALNTDMTVVAKAESASAFQWWLGRDRTNHVMFAVRNAAGQLGIAYAASATADLNWHHLAGVYDGARVLLYIDGGAAASASLTGSIAAVHRNLCIGALWSTTAAACSGAPFMNGAVDDVRVYVRALGQAEIQSTMGAEAKGTETGLAAYYNLNDGSGQIAYDLAGGHHGVLGATIAVEGSDPAWVGSGPDATPPIVAITSPADAQSLATSIPVTSVALDNVGVVGVQYRLDGVNLGPEVTISPFSTTLNATSLSSGTHALSAVARDAAGNLSAPFTVNFTVPGRVSGCHNMVLGGGWTCVDSSAVSATGGPVVSLGLVHNAAVPLHATIVVFADADMITGDGTMSCADNAGNVFTRAPMGKTTIDNGRNTVREVSYWFVLDSKAKASGYQASCTFSTTGFIQDLDMSLMVFKQDSGLPSAGVDTFLPWNSGYSAPGPCPCAIVPGGQTLTVTRANDLILGGGNMNGGFPQVNPPFVGVDGDGIYTGAAYFTSAAVSSGPGPYTLVWYDTLPTDGRASTVFALLAGR